jgi:hypothetical protein
VATEKQKGYIAVLQKKHGETPHVDPEISKKDASELIQELK